MGVEGEEDKEAVKSSKNVRSGTCHQLSFQNNSSGEQSSNSITKIQVIKRHKE